MGEEGEKRAMIRLDRTHMMPVSDDLGLIHMGIIGAQIFIRSA